MMSQRLLRLDFLQEMHDAPNGIAAHARTKSGRAEAGRRAKDETEKEEGMEKLNLTRRAFTKLAAVTGAAVAARPAAPEPRRWLRCRRGLRAATTSKRVQLRRRGCGKMECGVGDRAERSRRQGGGRSVVVPVER